MSSLCNDTLNIIFNHLYFDIYDAFVNDVIQEVMDKLDEFGLTKEISIIKKDFFFNKHIGVGRCNVLPNKINKDIWDKYKLFLIIPEANIYLDYSNLQSFSLVNKQFNKCFCDNDKIRILLEHHIIDYDSSYYWKNNYSHWKKLYNICVYEYTNTTVTLMPATNRPNYSRYIENSPRTKLVNKSLYYLKINFCNKTHNYTFYFCKNNNNEIVIDQTYMEYHDRGPSIILVDVQNNNIRTIEIYEEFDSILCNMFTGNSSDRKYQSLHERSPMWLKIKNYVKCNQKYYFSKN